MLPTSIPGLDQYIDDRIAEATAELEADLAALQASTAALDATINFLISVLISLIGSLNSLIVSLTSNVIGLRELRGYYREAMNTISFYVSKLGLNKISRVLPRLPG